jgi:hypothetical protein
VLPAAVIEQQSRRHPIMAGRQALKQRNAEIERARTLL